MRIPLLTPEPRKLKTTAGRFAFTDETRIALTPGCGDPELDAAQELVGAVEQYAETNPIVDRIAVHRLPENTIGLHLAKETQGAPEAYRLTIDPKRIAIRAPSSAGVFYGVQTLIQLVRQFGRRLPALRIDDRPTFRCRGFMLDVSRGRVPTLEHLKWLVDLLSHFKINMLQLYIEHTFRFRSHPDIGEGCSPLEPGELLDLERHCRRRHVDLIPSLQSFGHMGHILSLPKFRRLAEIEQFEDWETAGWHARLHGMTLAPTTAGSYRLLGELYDDFLPLFSSRFFNLNCDETWDLGQGRSAKEAARIGVGPLYLRHVQRAAELARRHDKTPMIWADIVYQNPELVDQVPDDIVLLDWAYEHDARVERCAALAEAGRRFLVCPGTSGWDRFFNDIWNATLNIRRFAETGRDHGAYGLMTTDWGDCGHFNMPGPSLHPAVFGAAMAWNAGRPRRDTTFDRAFSLHAFDDRDGEMGQAGRRLGSIERRRLQRASRAWPLWFSPLNDTAAGQTLPPKKIGPIVEAAQAALGTFLKCRPALERDSLSCLELALGASATLHLAARAQLEHERMGMETTVGKVISTWDDWADEAEAIWSEFETVWEARSKTSNLRDIRAAFRRQIRAARRRGQ